MADWICAHGIEANVCADMDCTATWAMACPTKETVSRLIDSVKATLEQYRRAVRKVDACCGCLNYEPFTHLYRGEAEEKCEDCSRELSLCACIKSEGPIT